MEDLTEIIRRIVEAINLTLNVKSIVGTRVYVCRTLHLSIGKIVTDSSGNQYKVTDFLNDEWIELEPYGATVDPFDDQVVICHDVTYLHGTPMSVNNEYLQVSKRTRDKTPFIWLLENYDEEEFGIESSVERRSRFKLFFMDETNEKKWTNTEHHRLVIQPMYNLIDAFMQVIKDDTIFKNYQVVTRKPRARFGVYVTNKGNTQKILDEKLSGAEITINLEKFREKKCYC